MLYTGLTDDKLRLWAPISASRAVSAAAELLVTIKVTIQNRLD